MTADILFALWFFLPAGMANMTPVLVAKLPGLRGYNQPIDGGRKWRGLPIFGANKTWRGLLSGIVVAVLVLWLQQIAYANYQWAVDISGGLDYSTVPVFLLGTLMGFGALAGDAIKSFFKRRSGLAAGDSWFPFDQLDYIAGGLLASAVVVRLELAEYAWIFGLWFLMHLVTSYIGFRLDLKARPV